MGIDIGSLFKKETITFDDLADRIVVIDAYNVLHQFLASIRQRDGTPLKDSKGNITSHLSGLFQRTANLVEAKIRPVYSFDGAPHQLKAKTLEERMMRKEQAEKEYLEALEAGDLQKARSKAQQTGRLTDEMIDQSKELLDALGIPYVQAPSEGEAQACHMVKKGDAYAVGSQDFDCLLFNTPILVRNLTSSGRRKLPGREAYAKVSIKQIRLKPNLESLGITNEQLIDMAILIGTDYNDGIHGIGPKKSLKLIKEHQKIENIYKKVELKDSPSLDMVKQLRSLFLKPDVTDDYKIEWPGVNKEKIMKILHDQHQFKTDRINQILSKYSNIEQVSRQKTLF